MELYRESMELRCDSARPPLPAVCGNCGCGLGGVYGGGVVGNDAVYCGHNCYWSVVLDVNNSRLRPRRARGNRKRRQPRVHEEPDTSVENTDAPEVLTPQSKDIPVEVSHAMFAYHTNVMEEASFRRSSFLAT